MLFNKRDFLQIINGAMIFVAFAESGGCWQLKIWLGVALPANVFLILAHPERFLQSLEPRKFQAV